jgi:hypothetical protein
MIIPKRMLILFLATTLISGCGLIENDQNSWFTYGHRSVDLKKVKTIRSVAKISVVAFPRVENVQDPDLVPYSAEYEFCKDSDHNFETDIVPISYISNHKRLKESIQAERSPEFLEKCNVSIQGKASIFFDEIEVRLRPINRDITEVITFDIRKGPAERKSVRLSRFDVDMEKMFSDWIEADAAIKSYIK